MIKLYIGCFCAVFLNGVLFFLVKNLILSVLDGAVNACMSVNKAAVGRKKLNSTFVNEAINAPLLLIFGLNLFLVNYIFTDYNARLIFPLFCALSFYLAYRLSRTRAFTLICKATEKIIGIALRPLALVIKKIFIDSVRKIILTQKRSSSKQNKRIKYKKINKNTNEQNIGT